MKDLFDLIKEKKIQLIICVALAAISSLLLIVPFALIYKIMAYYLQEGFNASPEPVITWLGLAFIALVLRYALTVSSFVFSHIAAFDLLYRIRVKITRHIGKLPMGFWGKRSSGEILKIVQEDVESIETFVAHHFPDAAAAFTLPLVTLAFLFAVDWRLALAAAIPMPIIVILLYMMWNGTLTGQNRKEIAEKYHKAIENMHSAMLEYVHGMPVVKVFNLNAVSFKKLKDSVSGYRDIVVERARGVSPYRALISTFILGGGLFILPLGIFLMENGGMDASKIILFLLLGTGCFGGLLKVIMITMNLELIKAGIKRINGILAAEPLSEPSVPQIPDKFDIELKNVFFQYHEGDTQVLKDINMALPEGSFTALVGPSGAGKTTIVNLMARMWETTGGSIRIGGVTLDEMGTKGVTETIGTVFQDVQMLTNTVRANICMGNINATQDEIESAAKAAACHDFIINLPHGYDTMIGDGGETQLSGGEKQRIAMARVILKNTSIILLDEATAYADAENESLMQRAFSKLMVKKTVVVIAHRLSTIVGADHIYVIDKGQVVESGIHQELLKQKGLYKTMWDARLKARQWHLSEKEA